MNIQFQKLYKLNETEFDKYEYLNDSITFLNQHIWHEGFTNIYAGLVVEGIVGIYLFEIIHSRDDVDDFVWVITGDIPPAYITCEDAPNPACALDGYIGAMREWVKAVKSDQDIENLIPVNVPPTKVWAEKLENRLNFLDEKILIDFQSDLLA
jgi:hypothetical protein